MQQWQTWGVPALFKFYNFLLYIDTRVQSTQKHPNGDCYQISYEPQNKQPLVCLRGGSVASVVQLLLRRHGERKTIQCLPHLRQPVMNNVTAFTTLPKT